MLSAESPVHERPVCTVIMSDNGPELQSGRRMRTTAEEIEAKEQELKKQEKEGHQTHTVCCSS